MGKVICLLVYRRVRRFCELGHRRVRYSCEQHVSETLFIMQPFVQKSNPDDTIVLQAKIVNDFNARWVPTRSG